MNGKRRKKNVGLATPANLDLAISLLNDHVEKSGWEFSAKRPSKPVGPSKQLVRPIGLYTEGNAANQTVRLIEKRVASFAANWTILKRLWSGRMIDTITYIDVRELRAKRLREGVKRVPLIGHIP